MRLSTFNSNARIPNSPLWRSLIVALSVAVVAAIAYEAFCRSLGATPSILDDTDLWCLEREKVADADEKTVLCLGMSRMQTGFATDVFRETCPDYEVLQLAIDGVPPMSTLRDIAENESFPGLIICSIMADALLPEGAHSGDEEVAYYHKQWNIIKKWKRIAFIHIQSHASFRQTIFGIHNMIKLIIRGRLPKGAPRFLVTNRDRSHGLDFEKVDLEAYRKKKVKAYTEHHNALNRPVDDAEWQTCMETIERLVEKIHAKGGKIVFVRFPSNGIRREFEEIRLPRATRWDAFARSTSAPTIHFEDVESLKNFDCPDYSHLDYRDARKFTKNLAHELIRLGILANGSARPMQP